MDKMARKGRSLLILFSLAYVLLTAGLIIINSIRTKTPVFQPLIQVICITVLLFFLLLRYGWAKWLSGAAFILSGSLGLYRNVPIYINNGINGIYVFYMSVFTVTIVMGILILLMPCISAYISSRKRISAQ